MQYKSASFGQKFLPRNISTIIIIMVIISAVYDAVLCPPSMRDALPINMIVCVLVLLLFALSV